MRQFVSAMLLGLVVASLGGCDNGSSVVTDPSKLPALTDEQKKSMREADDKIAEEETSKRTLPNSKAAK